MKKSWLILMILSCFINPAFGGQIVITTSDYSSGNTASYDIETGTMTDDLLPHHQDTNVKTDGTFLYVLEGYGKNSIIKVDPSPISVTNVIYNYSLSGDGSETNPQDMIFLDSKAYIILGDSDKIWVINQNATDEASFKTGEIDISQWSDSDGSPDAALGFVYDGMVYVVLQGVIKSWPAIYETARIIKIDPSTDTIVDLDETQEGIQGIELIIKNPQSGFLNGSMLYLGGTTFGETDEGVMSINLANPTASGAQQMIIGEADLGGDCAGVACSGDGIVIVYILDENWNKSPRVIKGDEILELPVPDAGGGLIKVDGYYYVGSRDMNNPGLYMIDAATNTLVGDVIATTLPPYSITYIESLATSVAESDNTPPAFSIEAAYPNPFNPCTTISFNMTEACDVRVDVFSSAGQKVETLVNSFISAGTHSVVWNASQRSSGMYYIRISDGISTQISKVTMIK